LQKVLFFVLFVTDHVRCLQSIGLFVNNKKQHAKSEIKEQC